MRKTGFAWLQSWRTLSKMSVSFFIFDLILRLSTNLGILLSSKVLLVSVHAVVLVTLLDRATGGIKLVVAMIRENGQRERR